MSFQSKFKKIPFFLLSGCILLCTACCGQCIYGGSQHISVLSEAINPKVLASVQVNTPDHRHDLNAHGQRLYVSWSLPKTYQESQLRGVLKVRFNKPEQVEVPFEIRKLSGHMVYEVINEDYFTREGILAYMIQIFADDQEIDCYKHKMWTQLITFEDK